MSPRGRKSSEHAWVPQRVYPMRSAWYFCPKEGKKVRLAPLDAAPSAVIQAYNDHMASLGKTDTVGALIDAYLASSQFMEKAAKTQREYLKNAKVISKVFGEAHVDEVQPHHVREFMDKRSSKTAANREKAFFSLVYSWGYERGRCKSNPCKGVRRFTEKARDRYVEDWEFEVIHKHASERLQAAMDIAWLCAARKGDVLKLRRQDIRDDGLYIEQSKTGVRQLKEWTPRLRAAVEKALSQPSTHPTMHVFHNRSGTQLSAESLNNDWREAWDKARQEIEGLKRFTFHDLKAKGVSDYEGDDKRKFSGHKTERQVASYDRKVSKSPTLNPDKRR